MSGRYAIYFTGSGLSLVQDGESLDGTIGTGDATQSFSTPFTVGEWTHVAMSWNITNGTAAAYVNGLEVWTSATISNAIEMTGGARIMGSNCKRDTVDGLDKQFDGYLYDLQFYEQVLGADDVRQLHAYPGTKAGEGALAHRYTFDDNVNDVVGTAHGNESVDGTYVEAPLYVEDTPLGWWLDEVALHGSSVFFRINLQ